MPTLKSIASPSRRLALACAAAGFFFGHWLQLQAEVASSDERILTTIKEIRSLSPTEADRGLPVRVRGIVTRKTRFEIFIQDGAEAIFIWIHDADPKCAMGDYVEVTGTAQNGHLFPLIKENGIRVLDHRSLPQPLKTHYFDLASGRQDCQWVEIAGIVRTAEIRPEGLLALRIAFDGTSMQTMVTEPAMFPPALLIGAQVRLRGVVGGSKTTLRQMIEPVLWVTYMPETFVIEAPAPADIFAMPVQSVDTLLASGRNSFSGAMIRVRGIATRQPSPDLLFLRDGSHCLEIRLQQHVSVKAGDHVEAVGFPEMGLIQPILQNAFLRTLSAGPEPVPIRCTARELLDFQHEADFIHVEGELREWFQHGSGVTMVVSDAGVLFGVDVEAPPPAAEKAPPVGSRIALVGISQINRLGAPDVFQVVAPASFRVRLQSMADLIVLNRPSWWTPKRLLAAVSVLSVIVLGAMGWIWSLDRRVRTQTAIILRNSQDAVMLEERNRIARELHDTLEQQLAGATILLDAIATVLTEKPERAREGLNTVRAMLRHGLEEAQQAVMDLRSNDLFEQDLRPLIEDSVRERLQSTAIKIGFECQGTWPELETMVKKHILRIIQEAVTNAVKHASPTEIKVVMISAEDRVEFRVVDNGCGFSTATPGPRGPGEFGLIGLQERAEKIGGRLRIQSTPNQGTTISLSLDLSRVEIL